jgi:hypothetical protein
MVVPMSPRTRIALIVGAPLAGLAALALVPRPVELLVTNPGARPISVQVSGLPPVLVAPGTSARLEVTAGAQLLRAFDGDTPTATLEASLSRSPLEPRPTWVWSVAPVESAFYALSKGYGDRDGLLETAPWVAPGALFRLPRSIDGHGVLPSIDEDLPKQVLLAPGETTGAVRIELCTAAHLDRVAPRDAVLIVTNPVGSPLRLSVDGVDLGLVPIRGTLELKRPAGPVRLEALELGPQGQPGRLFRAEPTIEVDAYLRPAAVWVWNVGSLERRYVVVARVYGGSPEDAPPRPGAFAPTAEVFRLPSGWYPHIDQPFPDTWSRRGALSVVWTYQHYLRAGLESIQLDSGSVQPHASEPLPGAPVPPPDAPR